MAKRKVRRRKAAAVNDALPADLHPVIRRVLLARGVGDAKSLDLKLARLQPPAGLAGVQQAADLLAEAIVKDQRIMVVGDFDADGATGAALMVRALRMMGAANAGFRVPNRFEFGYGLSTALVETLADEPPDVLVTVDSGISSIRGVERARELGCTVVVTDHHLPGEALPAADAIVNPNCRGDGFPSKALAGVGVVFYLAGVVRRALRARDWFTLPRQEPNLAQLLDLVALGTVADLVPLDANNRILVNQGMERIRAGRCSAGLLALLRVGNRDYRHVVAADLAYAVAPRLNAAGRLEDMGVGIRCLLTDDHDEAMALAMELDALNQARKSVQADMQEAAFAQVRELLAGLGEDVLPPGLCLFDESWHQGIVGLVASRIKEAVHRPVVAFAPETLASGSDPNASAFESDPSGKILKGSARSIEGLHIRDVLARVDALHPNMITAFGGHAMAAGLTLESGMFEAFREAFEQSIDHFLHGETLENVILTDGELEADDIGLDLAERLRGLEPWGQRFPQPLFEGRFVVEEQRVVGGAHLKMTVIPVGGRRAIDAIAFRCMPDDLPQTSTIGLVYRLDVNHFRGNKTCQLVVEQILD